eukprot:TRINITY_DN66372_c0_g1_i1.p1 TRINITY_DN66372_c0_g1~~TRINITY_DN66372_c0_g1_i1.p1  ORF type:complete len:200 (-),score=27.56 TRINITY_DN66372_c0_g1_i1:94-693(-)
MGDSIGIRVPRGTLNCFMMIGDAQGSVSFTLEKSAQDHASKLGRDPESEVSAIMMDLASHYRCSVCVLALRRNQQIHLNAKCKMGKTVFESDVNLNDNDGDAFQLFHHHIGRRLPIVIYDAACDEKVRTDPFVVEAPHVRFYAAAPIFSADGVCLGTLCIVDTGPRASFELSEADTLCQQASVVARLLGERSKDDAKEP